MTRVTLLALTAVAVALLSGCAGNGTPIADGQRCEAWLNGNGRDRYLAAHGMAEYDVGNTRRGDHMAVRVGAQMDRICKDSPSLLIDEALRLAAGAAPAAAPKASPEASTTETPRAGRAKRP
ncbi:MAG: hypothetical protein WKF42_03585 [Solirubrobacteraceae bacterium]